MTIERKFDMLSTREWLQYLQYRLSPDREKEIENRIQVDDFLRDAIASLEPQENRPIAFQSINMLIGMVQEYTGVSESKIAKSSSGGYPRNSSKLSTNINSKMIALIVGGLILICALGYGVYYVVTNSALSNTEEVDSNMIDSIATASSAYADSSNQPFESLPGSANAVDSVPTSVANPMNSANKPANKPSASNNGASSSPVSQTSASNSGAEQEKFDRAQELWKQNKPEEAKKLLNELKSYDNSKKAQAEQILRNMEVGN